MACDANPSERFYVMSSRLWRYEMPFSPCLLIIWWAGRVVHCYSYLRHHSKRWVLLGSRRVTKDDRLIKHGFYLIGWFEELKYIQQFLSWCILVYGAFFCSSLLPQLCRSLPRRLPLILPLFCYSPCRLLLGFQGFTRVIINSAEEKMAVRVWHQIPWITVQDNHKQVNTQSNNACGNWPSWKDQIARSKQCATHVASSIQTKRKTEHFDTARLYWHNSH